MCAATTMITPARPSLRVSELERILLIADDVTGACDAAATFLRTGRSVRVWFGPEPSFSAPEAVQAVNTNSRALSPGQAAFAVSRAASLLRNTPHALIFKKIDSAARGPIAAEILAAHRTLATRAILFAPAFPANGRIVRKGILEIRDASGRHSQTDLTALFPPDVQSSIGHVHGSAQLAPALAARKTILICDAATQTDLEDLVHASDDLPDMLYAGSAGLALALAGLYGRSASPVAMPLASPVLVVAGTPHPVTQLQLENLVRENQGDLHVLRVEDPHHAAERISSAFQSFSPRALILTGGDTALLAVRVLGAHSFILQGEFAPGIPWGIIKGGVAEGCIVVTKSGGFGSPMVLNEVLATLRGPA